MKLASIPKSLQSTSRWIWWDKHKKPHSVITGRPIDPTNAANGASYEAAVNFIKQKQDAGLGFLLGDGFTGIDIDGAFTDVGELKGDAKAIIEMLKPCYAERSPSGKGVHILGFGIKNTSLCRKALKDSKMLEVYDKDRYFTVTGDILPDLMPRLANLCNNFFPEEIREETKVEEETSWTDDEVIGAIRKSEAHSFIFEDLWNGDISRYNGYQSRADAALVERLLFFSGGKEQQTDRLFRQSKLMREKWDEFRGRRTYGQLTIARVKNSMTVFCCRHRPLTEIGVAERISDQYGDSIRYCHDWGKWLIWDETRWDIDKINKVQSMAVKVIRNIPVEAGSMDEDAQKAYVKFAKGLEKNNVVSNVLKQTERLVPVLSTDLDANLW